jgi:hypothetical protein
VVAVTSGETEQALETTDQALVVLSTEEAMLLAQILKGYLGDLRMEIADTDNPGLRRDLRTEEEAIRGLIARLPVP